ncbi:FG-GAP-like repeat-containing protein [Agromyces albus]|uniref:FG-GAP-like repeat-containing protein n=1 Tax=Agromyces albus TaxID=205332 RepID=UPI00278A8A67|nr:FG-GAP-like repeat-containing protein [Agromyces albus]MDQ0576292.1 hypothetical protein [Agromyces albus]
MDRSSGRTRSRILVAVAAIAALCFGSLAAASPASAEEATGTVSGTVTGTDTAGAGIADVEVELYYYVAEAWIEVEATATTDVNGTFVLEDVPVRTYHVAARPSSDDYMPDVGGRQVTVVAGETVTVDCVLERTAVIAGNVKAETADGGITAAQGGSVTASRDEQQSYSGRIDQNGDYSIKVPAGTYVVGFNQVRELLPQYLPEFWEDKPDRASADEIVLAAGETRAGIDATLALGGTISGRISRPDGPVEEWAANAVLWMLNDGTWEIVVPYAGRTDADGEYSFRGLHPGTYKVQFNERGGVVEYYDNVQDLASARELVIVDHETIPDVDAVIGTDVVPTPTIGSEADVVAVDTATGVLSVYPATGSGELGAAVAIGPGWGSAKAIYNVDWNNDGLQDVVAQWSDGRLTLYRGEFDGGFTAPVQIGSGWQSWSITIGPWKVGDRYPGIVARSSTGELSHYPNTTGGALTSATAIGSGWAGLSLTQMDFDGDGHQDLLARSKDGSVRLYRSNGVGGFMDEARTVVATGWNTMNSVSTLFGFDGATSSGIAARTTATGDLSYYPVGAGALGSPTTIGTGWNDRLIAGAPLHNDLPTVKLAAADVIAVDAQSRLWRYQATGTGGVEGGVQIGAGWSGLLSAFVIDWNIDGVQDVVAQWADGRLTLHPGLADGGLGAPTTIGTGWESWSITVGAWKNSDSRPGIVAKSSTGGLYYYPNTTGGALTTATAIGSGWSGLGITQVDFDRDGKQDILARTSDGALRLYRSNGSGGFISEPRAVVGTGWNAMTAIAPTTGFAGDSSLGLVARSTGGELRYYPIKTGGTWGPTKTVGSGWNGYVIFGTSTLK